MKIFEISARFMRRVQVQNFEPAEAEITLRAQIAEGETGPDAGDAKEAAQALLLQARGAVHGILLGTLKDKTPAPIIATATPQTLAPAVPKAAEPTEPKAPVTPPVTAEEPPKGRGGKKKKDDDIPGDPPVTTVTAAAKGAATITAPVSDIPDAPPKTAPAAGAPSGITAEELQRYIAQNIKDKKLNGGVVREILESKEFGVVRLGVLTPEQLVAFKKAVDSKISV